jgi:hypothetical protein
MIHLFATTASAACAISAAIGIEKSHSPLKKPAS